MARQGRAFNLDVEEVIIYQDIQYDGPDSVTYVIDRPDGGWRRRFTDEDLRKLRPIAETCAMLDGNAFFKLSDDLWKNYLQEADAIYRSNGGDLGHAGGVSWLEEHDMIQEDPALKDLWDKLQVMIELKRK